MIHVSSSCRVIPKLDIEAVFQAPQYQCSQPNCGATLWYYASFALLVFIGLRKGKSSNRNFVTEWEDWFGLQLWSQK